MKKLFVVVLALGSSACLHAAMERQIGLAEDCKDVHVVDQMAGTARVNVCGEVKTCRYDQNKTSWVCEEKP